MRISLLLVLAATACKWTDFDDLKDEAWVNATEAPDNGSTNWGLAIASSRLASGDGGRVTVLGTAASIYDELTYSNAGGAKLAGTELELGDVGIANLELQPILLADPSGDNTALVTKRGPLETVVLEGKDGALTPHQVFGADTADAAAFMVAPGFGGGEPQPAQPIVASVDVLFGTVYAPAPGSMQPKCKLTEAGAAVTIRAVGAVRFGTNTTDEVVVLSSAGKLYILPGDVFNGHIGNGACPDTNADMIGDFDVATANAGGPVPQVDVGIAFQPGIGSQILVFGTFAIVQAHDVNTKASHLQLVNLGDGAAVLPSTVGNPQTQAGLVQAAIWQDGTSTAVVAGYPTAQVDGVTCGKVDVYPIDTATGILADPTEFLNDAQPDDGQSFGRAVAVVPFNSTPIIAVGANNEVFMYFRTSQLYGETRQGR